MLMRIENSTRVTGNTLSSQSWECQELILLDKVIDFRLRTGLLSLRRQLPGLSNFSTLTPNPRFTTLFWNR
jgi:hypothetical protein